MEIKDEMIAYLLKRVQFYEDMPVQDVNSNNNIENGFKMFALEKEVKKLKNENQQLTEQNKQLRNDIIEARDEFSGQLELTEKFKKENDDLKQEMSQMRKHIEELVKR